MSNVDADDAVWENIQQLFAVNSFRKNMKRVLNTSFLLTDLLSGKVKRICPLLPTVSNEVMGE